MKHLAIAVTFAFGIISSAVLAQSTVGELLAAGAKKLNGEEVKKLVSGTRMTGVVSAAGSDERPVDFSMHANGRIDGTALSTKFGGPYLGVTGAWDVNEKGALCMDTKFSNGKDAHGCTVIFSFMDKYFAASSKDKEGAKLMTRSFKPL